jgi:hypothetical protein
MWAGVLAVPPVETNRTHQNTTSVVVLLVVDDRILCVPVLRSCVFPYHLISDFVIARSSTYSELFFSRFRGFFAETNYSLLRKTVCLVHAIA